MSETNVEEMQAALEAAGCRWGASEAHGTLLGLACVDAHTPVARWVGEIDRASEAPEGAAHRAMSDLGERALAPLRGGEFEFSPLLPDDDAGLIDRTGALAQWCQGFLYGLALTGFDPKRDGTGDVPEVLADMAEITRAQFGDDQSLEEGEAAYAELVEFVRVAVQLVYYELATSGSQKGVQP